MSQGSLKAARNRAYRLVERADTDLERGEIDEEGWHRAVAAVITPAYLAADNPRAQSGYSGDDLMWEHARSLICKAIDRNGSFLDVGCASGYLMECVQRWARAQGRTLEPYGLDISPGLAVLARRRLPHWADRVHVGNAASWLPETRFDFVRTGLEYVSVRRRRDLIQHLLQYVVAPNGRLIIGSYSEERDRPSEEATVASWGFTIAGSYRQHHQDARPVYRVFWIDAAGR
jgi:SAM-dependent methyltransferase